MKYIAILLLVFPFSVAPVIAEGKLPKVDIQRMKAKAEQGDAKAQLLLALMYDTGNGVPQDNRKSFEWCKKSAEHGFAEAQLLLGLMYDVGNGVPKSNKKAVKWCRKAANQGYAEAQLVLGGMHSNGLGVIQNDVLAYIVSIRRYSSYPFFQEFLLYMCSQSSHSEIFHRQFEN